MATARQHRRRWLPRERRRLWLLSPTVFALERLFAGFQKLSIPRGFPREDHWVCRIPGPAACPLGMTCQSVHEPLGLRA